MSKAPHTAERVHLHTHGNLFMPEPANAPPDTDSERLSLCQRLGFTPRSFFDVGASNGCWSARVSKVFPDAAFELFEPLADSPPYTERMQIILSKHPRFRLHKFALGAECRKTKMYLPPNLPGSTALELGDRVPAGWQCVEVDMLTLDYAVEEFRLAAPDVMKVDTQGCELSVLEGARRTLPNIQLLVLECWLARSYGNGTPLLLEIAQWLREFDFHLWDVGDTWRDNDGTLCSQDCFFLNASCPASRLRAEPRRYAPPERPGQEVWLERMRHFLSRRA